MAIDSRRKIKRDRHERGLHGPLLPHSAPFHENPDQFFVRQMDIALTEYGQRLDDQFKLISFGVESVPSDRDFVLSNGVVPLGRIERCNPNVIVVYQRPIEVRATNKYLVIRVLRDVLAELISRLLNIEPHDVDPDYVGPGFRG